MHMKSGFEFVIPSVWMEENEEQGKDKLGSKRNEGGSDPSATKRVQSSCSHALVLFQRVTEEGLTRRCLKDSIRTSVSCWAWTRCSKLEDFYSFRIETEIPFPGETPSQDFKVKHESSELSAFCGFQTLKCILIIWARVSGLIAIQLFGVFASKTFLYKIGWVDGLTVGRI